MPMRKFLKTWSKWPICSRRVKGNFFIKRETLILVFQFAWNTQHDHDQAVTECQSCESRQVLSMTFTFFIYIILWIEFTQIGIIILRMVCPYSNIILKWSWQTSPGSHRDSTHTWTVAPGILFWHRDWMLHKGNCLNKDKSLLCKGLDRLES